MDSPSMNNSLLYIFVFISGSGTTSVDLYDVGIPWILGFPSTFRRVFGKCIQYFFSLPKIPIIL